MLCRKQKIAFLYGPQNQKKLLPSDEGRWIRFSEDGGVESPSLGNLTGNQGLHLVLTLKQAYITRIKVVSISLTIGITSTNRREHI